MGAHIEWIAGILRVGPELTNFGDPFEFMCVVLRDEGTVIFKGATSDKIVDLLKERDGIRKQLEILGPITKVQWTRKDNGREKIVEIKL